MNYGPIEQCLKEILGHEAAEHLILVGGAAILVKRGWLERIQAKTLITAIPLARSTEDVDFLLSLDLFVRRDGGREIRSMLDELKYIPKQEFWQFAKGDITVDFLARIPTGESGVKLNEPRVGAKPSIRLHGHVTPEAFAVEVNPAMIEVVFGNGPSTEIRKANVAHTYGMLNMKTRAAFDWLQRRLRGEAPKPFSEKHALDVYILTASMTFGELEECRAMAANYVDHPIARAICQEAKNLFSHPNSPGYLEAQRQVQMELDHAVFWDGLREALGIDTVVIP